MADMHIDGLGSSYDLTGIIAKMVAAKAAPQKTWITEKDALTRDVAAWADISTYMTSLTDSLNVLRSWETWNKMAATSSDATKVSATAGSSATEAVYSLAITTLARAHSVASKHIQPILDPLPLFTNAGAATVGTASLAQIGDGGGATSASWQATYDGAAWTIVNTTTGSTVATLTAAPGGGGTVNLENSGLNGFSLTIDPPSFGTYDSGDKFTFTNVKRTATTDLVAAGILTATHSFVIEGKTITIDAVETLTTLMTKINNASASMSTANKVTASIVDNRLVMTRNNTGGTNITMSDSAPGTALADLDIFATGAYQHELVTAADALFTVNGATVTRSSNTNLTDVISGVTLNLLGTGTGLTLSVAHDTATPKTAIQDFVTKYNAAATQLQNYGKIGITGSSLDPSGAKVDTENMGELYNDSLVNQIITGMRKQATDAKYPDLNNVNAAYTYDGRTGIMDSLDDIGVWTTSRDNQLSVTNEAKMDYNLAANFDKCEQLFRGIYDPVAGYEHGVATDFYQYSNNVSTSMTGNIATRTRTLTDQTSDLEDRITQMDKDLKDYEQQLWEIFSDMDSAISKSQSNMTAFNNALGIS